VGVGVMKDYVCCLKVSIFFFSTVGKGSVAG